MTAADVLRRLGRLLHLGDGAGDRPVASVYAIRCPWCRSWVKPARFDMGHMACRSCIATLHRPTRRTSRMRTGVRRCR